VSEQGDNYVDIEWKCPATDSRSTVFRYITEYSLDAGRSEGRRQSAGRSHTSLLDCLPLARTLVSVPDLRLEPVWQRTTQGDSGTRVRSTTLWYVGAVFL